MRMRTPLMFAKPTKRFASGRRRRPRAICSGMKLLRPPRKPAQRQFTPAMVFCRSGNGLHAQCVTPDWCGLVRLPKPSRPWVQKQLLELWRSPMAFRLCLVRRKRFVMRKKRRPSPRSSAIRYFSKRLLVAAARGCGSCVTPPKLRARWIRRSAKQRMRLATMRSMSRSTSKVRATWRFRFLPISTAPSFRWANANAQCSAGIKK